MDILSINAYLKHIEFLLNYIDSADESKTIGELRKDFIEKFKIDLPHMLSQNFGIVRLIPLLLIREELKNKGNQYDRRISIVRHALAHNNFSTTDAGYEFMSDIGSIKMGYSEFVEFIWQLENEFHLNKLNTI
jgi:hypothetical protein